MSQPLIRPATPRDSAQLCALYNAGIATGTATFETEPRARSDIEVWFEHSQDYPIIVASHGEHILGFARLSAYSSRPCYRSIGEFSIYVSASAKGQGMGTQLLAALLNRAQQLGFSKLLSRIFTTNTASLALCNKLGFREVGIYHRHGQINGKWLDVVIVEKCL